MNLSGGLLVRRIVAGGGDGLIQVHVDHDKTAITGASNTSCTTCGGRATCRRGLKGLSRIDPLHDGLLQRGNIVGNPCAGQRRQWFGDGLISRTHL